MKMRRLWKPENWHELIDCNSRKGIRLRFETGVSPEVRLACIRFVSWLRTEYEFPIRVCIYFKSLKVITSLSGESVSASFLGPFDISQEPYIRIAVGDYNELLEDVGRDNALAAILHSIAHELSHYFQWIKDHENWINASIKSNEKYEKQAKYYADQIILDYAKVVDHP